MGIMEEEARQLRRSAYTVRDSDKRAELATNSAEIAVNRTS
jgi:hypothetical protein